jgi:hypothetical protein|tara:strand:+ start:235 stop:417 length:183 start_codon:yes stop_codon:yes gene_type:complete
MNGYCENNTTSIKDIKEQPSPDKLEEKNIYIKCEKRAKLAPTAYSTKRIKASCLKEHGIK